MPYQIEKFKNGFRLKDVNGHYYSNKPMTKKKVIAQMKAIELSKHKNHKLYPQYVRETGDISGAGFTDWIKKATSKVKDVATNIKDRAVGFITGVRDDYPPDVRKLLKIYGNNKVVKIVVRRDPLKKAIDIAVNVLSFGQFEKSKKEAGYDDYYHLYMIATLDNGINLLIEKNEVINIEVYNKSPTDGDSFQVMMKDPIILNDMLEKTKNGMGVKRYFYYDPITDNCQIFLNSIMFYNGLLNINPELQKFIMQDYRTLIKNLSPATKGLMSGITGLARRVNILTKGKGFNFHPLHLMV